MIVEFNENFDKDLLKLDKKIILKIFDKINDLKNTHDLTNISWVKKMTWYKYYYRIRIWDYRLWFTFNNWKIILERFLHRKDIYNYFPK